MKLRRLLTGLTAIATVVTPVTIMTSCVDNNSNKVTKIKITGASTVAQGCEITLKATVEPSTAENQEVTWSVSDSAVATITQDGVLTGGLKGTVTVTATAKDGSGVKGTKEVKVTAPVKVTSVTVTKKAIPAQLDVGASTKLDLTILPTDASNKNVTWTVTPDTVAKVDSNNVLTGLSAGTATVRATANDGTEKYGETSITVVEPTPTSQSYEDYIFDRTFSISGWGPTYLTYGTGWILSDATPNDLTDYKYYIATNWHVIKGMEEVGATEYRYGCEYSSGTSIAQSETIEFTQFEPIKEVNFTYNGKSKITIEDYYGSYTGLQGCDVYVALVDFASCKTSESQCASVTKNKLDRLNQLTASGKKITELAPTTTDSSHYESLKLYTGGYPADNHPNPIWEHHDLSTSDENIPLTYCKHATSYSYDYAHTADNSSSPLIDCSPQYAYLGSKTFEDWMTGGASGSMLIGDFGSGSNHIWKVVGIYWGGMGYETESHDYIQPYYSIFNSDWKNYLADWM